MKRVPQPQIILQERTGKVVVNLTVVPAHTRRGIQNQYQIDGRTLLPKDVSPDKYKKR
jgi:hypothetical protein